MLFLFIHFYIFLKCFLFFLYLEIFYRLNYVGEVSVKLSDLSSYRFGLRRFHTYQNYTKTLTLKLSSDIVSIPSLWPLLTLYDSKERTSLLWLTESYVTYLWKDTYTKFHMYIRSFVSVFYILTLWWYTLMIYLCFYSFRLGDYCQFNFLYMDHFLSIVTLPYIYKLIIYIYSI